MKLKEIGEFGLIDIIKEGAIFNHAGVEAGIGDDAAVYLPETGLYQLLTTDMLVENVHFLLDRLRRNSWDISRWP
jgi:thiamine-monophosphate kinase